MHPIDWTEGGDWQFKPEPEVVRRWFMETVPHLNGTARWDFVREIKATTTLRVSPPQPMPYRAGDEILTVSNDDDEVWRYVLTRGFPDGRREWTAQVWTGPRGGRRG